MTFNEMIEAVREARATINEADRKVNEMAGLIVGRLRSGGVSAYTLERLKKELRDFNIHTSQWRKHD